ncbi:MAG TPA: zinc ribbon domain-containing protein, partial [Anaerolineales bacterium]|nr:zinc ribbon domain-containing protein [Anaerolineales bacterium]
PYAVFYCESCDREYRSQPEVVDTIAKDIGKQAMSGFLRNIPLVGSAVAQSVTGDDPRYSLHLSPAQLEKAWDQVKVNFRECPTCLRTVCLSDYDEKSGFCNEDSPRRNEIAGAQAEQAGAVIKGFASAFGLDKTFKQVTEAASQAAAASARCPKDGMLAPAGTKFCPECGEAMVQPAADPCPSCGNPTNGAKFCPECGTKIERKPVGVCPSCGAATGAAKFCPECGAKQT